MTIEFKENDHIDEDKLDDMEAYDFVYCFLFPELYRHIELQATAKINANKCAIRGEKTASVAWTSSATEHQKDIDYINKTVKKFSKKFGWKIWLNMKEK